MTTSIKVSDIVHEELERRKQEGESFDDVLKRLLDLLPALDGLVAYFTPEMAETAKELVAHVEEQGDFETEVEDDEVAFLLNFVAPATDRRIAHAKFLEDQMRLYYRDPHGEMKQIGFLTDHDGPDTFVIGKSEKSIDEAKETIERKITGAYEKWGEDG